MDFELLPSFYVGPSWDISQATLVIIKSEYNNKFL